MFEIMKIIRFYNYAFLHIELQIAWSIGQYRNISWYRPKR